MYKKILLTMEDGKKQSVPFKATGTTQIRYRMIFHRELIKDLSNVSRALGDLSAAGATANEIGMEMAGSDDFDVIGKLAYVMNLQATGSDLGQATEEGYLEWLDQFDPMEILSHSNEILSTYISSRRTASKAKKKNDQPTET